MKEENNNINNELNNSSSNYSKIMIATLAILLIGALGFIIYDKFINKEKPPVPTPTPTTIPTPTNNEFTDEITTLKEISIPNSDEEVNVDFNGKNYLIQIKDGHLFINNKQIFNSNNDPLSAQNVYVTNKYILFTEVAQDWSVASYAIDSDENKIDIVDNDYQIHDLKLENGVLTAKGHIFCGLDGDCPDKDLIIKYDNSIITISPKNH